jgi:hypothetical protein
MKLGDLILALQQLYQEHVGTDESKDIEVLCVGNPRVGYRSRIDPDRPFRDGDPEYDRGQKIVRL